MSLDRVLRFAEEIPLAMLVAPEPFADAVANRAARERLTDDGGARLMLALAMREDRRVGPLETSGLRCIATPVHGEAGEVTGGVAILLDTIGDAAHDADALDALAAHVEALRRAENASREREREVRDVTDALPLIVWTATATGDIESYNSRWYEYTGLPYGDVPGFGWAGVVHPDDFASTVLAYARGLDSGERFSVESRLRGADGTYRRHRSTAEPVRDVRGTVYRWVGSTQDVEAQTRAQAAQERLLARAEHTTAQLRFLAELGRTLSRSLDFDTTAEAIVAHVVPGYADWAVLRLLDADGRMRTVAIAHDRLDARPLLDDLVRGPVSLDLATAALAEAVRTQTTVLHERVDARAVAALDPAVRPHSCAMIPLVFAGKVSGALQLVYTSDARRYETHDVALLEEIGRRCAAAIANAIRFQSEHRVADRLQRALLPSVLPRLDGIRLDAFYSAGRGEAQIGGDWYDAFRVSETRLVLAIGDVSGSGLDAAVTMAGVRQSMRSLSQVDPDPSVVLDMADRALRSEDPSALVTAFLLVFDFASRTLTYASAGHPPPLLRAPDGEVRVLHEPDLPLGIRNGDGPGARTIAIEPGTTLVLYTDGVTEARRDAIDGERRLVAALVAAPVASDLPLAQHLAATVLPDGSIDDAAILTMRFDGVVTRAPR